MKDQFQDKIVMDVGAGTGACDPKKFENILINELLNLPDLDDHL